ncbi:MAG: VWA domain-containing protein [Marinilabiliaceae bacterium]|nr:VWA domain-containing protein [Marinilabiliaceae bacterium]
MFRFAHPEFLYVLIIIPVIALINLFLTNKRRKALEQFGDINLLKKLMPEVSKNRPIVKFYLLMLALTILILMIAQPQFGSKLETVKRKGIEIMIALDVSNSMNAQDIEPSRLERAKQAIAQMVDKMSNDKIGIIVFAGQAYTQLPITTDYPSAKMFLNTINTGLVPTQGTAIGLAINRAMVSFSQEEEINRAIIVITDGENHEDDAIAAATKAYEKGIKVYTVGMGLPNGAPIPINPQKPSDFMKDRQGNVVISKLNEGMLQQIAMAANGNYIPANNIRNGINKLIEELGELEKKEIEAKIYTDYDDQFPYLAAIVLILLLTEAIIIERKNRFLKNIKLFETNNDAKNEFKNQF